MAGLGDVVRALMMLPPWALSIVGALGAVWFLRGFTFRTRAKQIREAVRRLVRAEPEDRDRLIARAFERAGRSPDLLALLVAETWKRQMPALHARALQALDDVPGGAVHAARLRREAARPADVGPLHPLEVVVRARALLDEGLVDAARDRVDEALRGHPGHPALTAMRAEVDQREKAPIPEP